MKGIKRKLLFICLILVTVLVFCFVYFNINKGDKEDLEVTKVEGSDVEIIEWHLFDNLFQDDWYYTVDFINNTVSYRHEGGMKLRLPVMILQIKKPNILWKQKMKAIMKLLFK